MLTPEQLLLGTLDDLDERLEIGRGEHDALCMAWLLRRLLLPRRRSLLFQPPKATAEAVSSS